MCWTSYEPTVLKHRIMITKFEARALFHVITVLEESDHLPTSWRHTLLPRSMLQRCGSRKPSVPDYGIPI